MEPKIVMTAALAIFTAACGKILWDWLWSGRTKQKSIYMTEKNCIDIRSRCKMHVFQDTMAGERLDHGQFRERTNARLEAAEKQLDQGREDFKALRKEIMAMNTAITKLCTVIEERLK
jgi:hypothetical protein